MIYARLLLLSCLLALPTPGHAQNLRWQATDGPVGGIAVTALQVHPDGSVFAGMRGGLFRTTDEGRSWSQIDLSFDSDVVHDLLVEPDGTLLAATERGLYRSRDVGRAWEPAGLAGEPVTVLSRNDDYLFAGTAHGTVHRLAHDSTTWRAAHAGLPSAPVRTLVTGTDGFLLAGTGQGLFRTLDHGESWQVIGLQQAQVNALVQSDTGLFYAATEAGDLYESTEDAASWHRILQIPLPTRDLFVRASGEILVGTQGGILRLTRAGTPLLNPYQVGEVMVDRVVEDGRGNLYAGTTAGGIYRSADGGTTWMTSNRGLGSTITALIVGAEGRLFAGTPYGGVYRSADQGQTWTTANGGLTSRGIVAFAYAPEAGLYAGTDDGYVFHSTDHGVNWTDTHLPSTAHVSVRGLFFDARGNLLAGTTRGLYRLPAGSTTWAPTSLAGYDIKAAGIAPDGTMYAGLPNILMRSSDHGHNWTSAGLLLEEVQALGFTEEALFAATVDRELYRTLTASTPALYWYPVDADLPVTDIRAFHLTESGSLLAASYGGGIYASSDDGTTWHTASDGLTNPYVLSFAAGPDGMLYAGTNAGVFRATDPALTARETPAGQPGHAVLAPAYPNPFHTTTTITYTLPAPAPVRLTLYDLLGRPVRVLVDAPAAQGVHTIPVDAGSLPAGTYLCRLQAGAYSTARLLTLIR